MQVLKRDGRTTEFNKQKIVDAIVSAMQHTIKGVDETIAYKIAEEIEKQVEGKETISVYDIQDIVEKKLMNSSRKEVAQRYIIYRYNRDVARRSKTKDIFLDIIGAKANDITRENANMNADTPAGMMMKFASETTKPFVDDYLLSSDVRTAMRKGYIHIHDKDYYPTKSLTCIQHPLDRILEHGFKAGHGASRPTKRIETASIIGCISMETIQNEMHGGQAIPAFDYYLAPYVRLTYIEEVKKVGEVVNEDLSRLFDYKINDYVKEDPNNYTGDERLVQIAINNTVGRVHQAMEAFIHNMNTIHSRGGNQVVFSSINYGTDTSAEGRCVIREMLNSTYEGVGNHETAIFPIQIWKKKKGINYNKEDRNYDLYQLSTKVCAKRFFPNYVNLDATFNVNDLWKEDDPKRYRYEVATMGCRTRVFENRFAEKSSIGRGNLSFSTINLPRLAIEAAHEAQERTGMYFPIGTNSESSMNSIYKETVLKVFMNKLTYYCDLTARQLFERYQFQCTALAKQFPLLMAGMWNGSDQLKPDDKIESVLKHGTLSIGFIGLAECLVALTGKHHGEDKESQKLGLKIVSTMRDLCAGYADKYNLNFSALATPAEGLSGRFTKIDRREYGLIKGVTDRDYYTNSNHVPVYYHCSAEHKAKIEAPYHELTRAGHIFYIELDGDAARNPSTVEAVVDLMDKYNMGYGSVNHTRTRCMSCGYETSDEIEVCPKCGSDNIDTIQRITGYLVGTTSRWNDAKLSELNDRVTHTGFEENNENRRIL